MVDKCPEIKINFFVLLHLPMKGLLMVGIVQNGILKTRGSLRVK